MNKHCTSGRTQSTDREAAGVQKANYTLWDPPSSLSQHFPIIHYANQIPKQLVWQQLAAWLLNREIDRAPLLYKDEFY